MFSIKTVSFTLLVCLCNCLGFSVENSIIPTIEKFEKIENIPAQKYSKAQYTEIEAALSRQGESFRVVTYNMLFNLYDQNLAPENRWPERLPRLVEILDEMQPDLLGVQELYPDQLKDLWPYLEQDYAFYTAPEGDGELNGIFYRKARFKVIDSQVWKMVDTSTLTMVQLRDRLTGKLFAHLNVHLALSNIEKRHAQVHFIGKKVDAIAKQMPLFLTGDMNTFPQRQDLAKLPFYDGDYVDRLFKKHALFDAKEVSVLGHLGPIGTFTNDSDDGIPFKGTGTPGVFLDHIYVTKGITVLIHAVQPGTVGGHFPSDHLPLIVDAVIE